MLKKREPPRSSSQPLGHFVGKAAVFEVHTDSMVSLIELSCFAVQRKCFKNGRDNILLLCSSVYHP
jgi:hypothetical protein